MDLLLAESTFPKAPCPPWERFTIKEVPFWRFYVNPGTPGTEVHIPTPTPLPQRTGDQLVNGLAIRTFVPVKADRQKTIILGPDQPGDCKIRFQRPRGVKEITVRHLAHQEEASFGLQKGKTCFYGEIFTCEDRIVITWAQAPKDLVGLLTSI